MGGDLTNDWVIYKAFTDQANKEEEPKVMLLALTHPDPLHIMLRSCSTSLPCPTDLLVFCKTLAC